MTGLGAVVTLLVISVAARTAPAPALGESLTPAMLRLGGEKDGLSWWKATGWTI